MAMQSNSSLLLVSTLTKFVKNICRAYVLLDGVVTDVNDNFTVDVTVQGVAYSNVPTKVLIGAQSSIYEVPVVGSKCLVKWRDGNRGLPQIDSFDKVDKYYIEPVSELYLKSPKIQFNNGDNGGIPLTPELVSQLNKIESQQNQILSILKGINIAATPFSFTPLFSSINPLSPTTDNDIQNPDITQ